MRLKLYQQAKSWTRRQRVLDVNLVRHMDTHPKLPDEQLLRHVDLEHSGHDLHFVIIDLPTYGSYEAACIGHPFARACVF